MANNKKPTGPKTPKPDKTAGYTKKPMETTSDDPFGFKSIDDPTGVSAPAPKSQSQEINDLNADNKRVDETQVPEITAPKVSLPSDNNIENIGRNFKAKIGAIVATNDPSTAVVRIKQTLDESMGQVQDALKTQNAAIKNITEKYAQDFKNITESMKGFRKELDDIQSKYKVLRDEIKSVKKQTKSGGSKDKSSNIQDNYGGLIGLGITAGLAGLKAIKNSDAGKGASKAYEGTVEQLKSNLSEEQRKAARDKALEGANQTWDAYKRYFEWFKDKAGKGASWLGEKPGEVIPPIVKQFDKAEKAGDNWLRDKFNSFDSYFKDKWKGYSGSGSQRPPGMMKLGGPMPMAKASMLPSMDNLKRFGQKFNYFGTNNIMPFEDQFYRETINQQKSQFMKFGQLPPGFEFVQGHMGTLGNPAAVAARGAQPISYQASGAYNYPGAWNPTFKQTLPSGKSSYSSSSDRTPITGAQQPSQSSVVQNTLPQGVQPQNQQKYLLGGANMPAWAAKDPEVVKAINEVAQKHGVDPAAISHVIDLESKWNPKNGTGSYHGLTQIGATTFKEAGGKLAGMNYSQFLSGSPADQIRVYGAWLDHYKFGSKVNAAGLDLSKMDVAQQAAFLQGVQFGPNNTSWYKGVAQGNPNARATNTPQARVLGATTFGDMTNYYNKQVSKNPAQYYDPNKPNSAVPAPNQQPQDNKQPVGNGLRGGYYDPITSHTFSHGVGQNSAARGFGGHQGVDLLAKRGSEVRAAMDGEVVRIGRDAFNQPTVTIRNADGTHSRYLHMGDIHVKVGDTVKGNQQIGTSGTANGTDHLHYELWPGQPGKGQPLDPKAIHGWTKDAPPKLYNPDQDTSKTESKYPSTGNNDQKTSPPMKLGGPNDKQQQPIELPPVNVIAPEKKPQSIMDFARRQNSGANETKDQPSRVNELQGKVAAVRKGDIKPELKKQLDYAASKTGVQVEVHSGGQPSSGPNRVGSHRHDHGGAADIKLYELDEKGNKRYLDMNDPKDAARMKEFVAHSVHAGATGVGAGQGYMGPNMLHIGGGTSTTWGGAPWIGAAHAQGMELRKQGPVNFDNTQSNQPNGNQRGNIVVTGAHSQTDTEARARQHFGNNVTFHGQGDFSGVIKSLEANPNQTVTLFSGGAAMSEKVASYMKAKGIPLSNLRIVEPHYTSDGRVAGAIKMGVPAKNVQVGSSPATGSNLAKDFDVSRTKKGTNHLESVHQSFSDTQNSLNPSGPPQNKMIGQLGRNEGSVWQDPMFGLPQAPNPMQGPDLASGPQTLGSLSRQDDAALRMMQNQRTITQQSDQGMAISGKRPPGATPIETPQAPSPLEAPDTFVPPPEPPPQKSLDEDLASYNPDGGVDTNYDKEAGKEDNGSKPSAATTPNRTDGYPKFGNHPESQQESPGSSGMGSYGRCFV